MLLTLSSETIGAPLTLGYLLWRLRLPNMAAANGATGPRQEEGADDLHVPPIARIPQRRCNILSPRIQPSHSTPAPAYAARAAEPPAHDLHILLHDCPLLCLGFVPRGPLTMPVFRNRDYTATHNH